MSKKDLLEQVEDMTEEEASEVRLVFAPDWPSKATSIAEIRKRTATKAMSAEKFETFMSEHGTQMLPPDGEG